LRRNCLFKNVIEGKLEGKTKGRGRRRRGRNYLVTLRKVEDTGI
jgi:hypothetical protein